MRQRLHVVLALSPAGLRLRQYCWAHPALLSCCNIDWYSEWSKEALLQVANNTYVNYSADFDWLGKVKQKTFTLSLFSPSDVEQLLIIL